MNYCVIPRTRLETCGERRMSCRLKTVALVGFASLLFTFHQARAATVLPAGQGCSASAGNGEQQVINNDCSSGVAQAFWPPPNILGSPVTASATASVSSNQSAQASANVMTDTGLVPTGKASASASISYYMIINPLSDTTPGNVVIPLFMAAGTTITVTTPISGAGAANASTELQIQMVAQTENNTVIDYLTEGPPAKIGSLNSIINLLGVQLYFITLTATASVGPGVGSDSAMIDPQFSFVDPSDASLYEIDFSPGITNNGFDTSTTPLPATLPLFAGGLGFVGYLTRRRKRAQAIAAA
jgi:hypothetical protein